MKIILILYMLFLPISVFSQVNICEDFVLKSQVDVVRLAAKGLCLIDEETSLSDLTYDRVTLHYSSELKLFYTSIYANNNRAALVPNDILYVMEPGNENLIEIGGRILKALTGNNLGKSDHGRLYLEKMDELAAEKEKNQRLREENRRLREENNGYTGDRSDPDIKVIETEHGSNEIGIPIEEGQPSGEMVALINSPNSNDNILGIGMLIRAYKHQNILLRKLNRYSRGRSVPGKFKGSNSLVSGSWMNEGEYLRANNGQHKFVIQGDGNLVLYSGKKAIWSSKTSGKGKYPFKLKMQNDGNLVVYGMGKAVWSTRTNRKGRGPFRLVMQSDRNVVLYDSLGRALWSTKSQLK